MNYSALFQVKNSAHFSRGDNIEIASYIEKTLKSSYPDPEIPSSFQPNFTRSISLGGGYSSFFKWKIPPFFKERKWRNGGNTLTNIKTLSSSEPLGEVQINLAQSPVVEGDIIVFKKDHYILKRDIMIVSHNRCNGINIGLCTCFYWPVLFLGWTMWFKDIFFYWLAKHDWMIVSLLKVQFF